MKPQLPQGNASILGECFLLLHPVLNLWSHLFRHTRERGDDFLMRLERKACAVRMVRSLALEYYAWNGLLRESSTSFSPSEFWGGRGLVKICVAFSHSSQCWLKKMASRPWSPTAKHTHIHLMWHWWTQCIQMTQAQSFYWEIRGKIDLFRILWLGHGFQCKREMPTSLLGKWWDTHKYGW